MNNLADGIPLSEIKYADPLALLRMAMPRIKEASQTLAAVTALAYKKGETFAGVEVIAEKACLPTRTVERHLKKLVKYQWLDKRGRQGRRTPTYRVPDDLRNSDSRHKFGLLPRWAATLLPTWAERAVFSLIVARHSLLETGTPRGGSLELNYGREHYSIAKLVEDSGLAKRSVITAKQSLVERELISIDSWYSPLGDEIFLNLDYCVPWHLIPAKRKQPTKPAKEPQVTWMERLLARGLDIPF